MIYGANGYTGRMASLYAKSLGIDLIVAGRTDDKINNFASSLNLPCRVFDVTFSHLVDSALNGVSVLLNCAGPFIRTAEPLMEACIRNKVHYLDTAAELDTYRLAEKLDQKSKEANVMLMPGCGGSVAMLGCLAGHVVERVQNASRIDVALHVAGPMSRGSAISAAENMTTECLQRVDGELVEQDATNTSLFDFQDGNGYVTSHPITLPDLITIWKATKVANIRVFVHASETAFPTQALDTLPDGPTSEERDAHPYHAAVSVTASDGVTSNAVLHTVNGYTFTSMASAEAAKRVLAGEAQGGFQTPAFIFGNDFIKSIAGSNIIDL
ncbi:hypothetical protein G7Z17_g3153 [Cylindrodendrum hubeiense]|uniref:Saccharopine dehydrogenase NADP binding domain-containing protein n=1 Tax=Cylindrodendrum hubeiense TaxID=595255 RepID=A0A9P5HHE2_9HYPO|nr:hypothetical protein G7Z17_g3153 [Cylindrodendrum hubeiense]